MRSPMHDSTRLAAPSGWFVALALWTCVPVGMLAVGGPANAQPVSDTALPALKSSRQLREQIPAQQRSSLPTFISGERLSSRTDLDSVIEGRAELRRGDMVIRADRLDYYQPDDLAKARGNVMVNRAGDVYEGPELELKVESFEGFFLNPRYRFLRNEGHGEAQRVDFIDEQRAVIRNASFTTCRRLPGPSWMPDWIVRAASISIDNEEEIGQAESAVLTFKGLPLLPIPAFSFPLSDKRKSGFLPPTFGLDNVNGLELVLPYYWNIAPNRDATLFPALLSKRGVDLAGEFRYLEPTYSGQLRANYLPSDRLRDRNRWGLAYSHAGSLDTGLAAIGKLAVGLSLNRVSDDNYWRDFSRVNPWLTQRLLSNDLSLSGASGYLSGSLRMLKWQTLQDTSAPIVPPYDRLPQITARYARSNLAGFDFSVDADSTQFESDRTLTLQPNGRRVYAALQVSHPWVSPVGFVVPKLQMHASNYQFNSALANGATSATRFLPTLSVDSGLVFERDASYFGRAFRQTLEPRAFYVLTPFRDQSQIPNYDSGSNDFNFATIYSDNAFVGNDRISDSNLLTVGLSTRLLDPVTGGEAARFGIAQRIRFKDQRVSLPGGAAVSKGFSDVLLGATVNLDPRWSVDSTVQFDPGAARSIRSTVGGRYSPGNYRVVSAAYRLQRGSSEQLDIGWQWPLNDLWGDRGEDLGAGRGQGEGRWYSVGRINYSLREGKLVDSVLGLEYDAGCWLGRIVLDQLKTGTRTSNRRIMFQLEFVGFSRLGVNPLQTLKQNIPRYQYLRETTTSPSRFGNYD
ncbi:MAG: LPS-assembly protein LptD [Rhodoferax sp.]|nr:LPS-assembly protein LptD [Rhodoferax sp.]